MTGVKPFDFGAMPKGASTPVSQPRPSIEDLAKKGAAADVGRAGVPVGRDEFMPKNKADTLGTSLGGVTPPTK